MATQTKLDALLAIPAQGLAARHLNHSRRRVGGHDSHAAAGQPYGILTGPASELENTLRRPEDLLQPRPDNLAQRPADCGVGKRCVVGACHFVKGAVVQVIFPERK